MRELPPVLIAQVRTVTGLAAVICVGTIAAIAAIIATHYPDNHVGADLRLGYVSAGAAAAAAGVAWRAGATRGRIALALLGVAALTAVVVFVADQWNLAVGYELWLRRGQPAFGDAPRWW